MADTIKISDFEIQKNNLDKKFKVSDEQFSQVLALKELTLAIKQLTTAIRQTNGR